MKMALNLTTKVMKIEVKVSEFKGKNKTFGFYFLRGAYRAAPKLDI